MDSPLVVHAGFISTLYAGSSGSRAQSGSCCCCYWVVFRQAGSIVDGLLAGLLGGG
jgi:hypothetical protein